MKKIRVWKVALLNVVTLGIYSLFWLANRRAEMVKDHGQKVPHWAWFIVPWLVVFGSLVPVIVLLAMVNVSQEQMALIAPWYLLVSLLVAYGFSIWWMWKFSRSAEHVTNGRITYGWIIALYLVAGSTVTLFLQYYFNRASLPKARKTEVSYEPTSKFVAVALATIIVSVASFVPLSMMNWQELEQASIPAELSVPELKTSDIFAELNKERGSQHKTPLKLDKNLVSTAEHSCADMERDKYYDFENPKTGHSGYEYMDEYYAGGTTMEVILAVSNFKAEGVIGEWMKSADTRDSILSTNYVAAGIATCQYTIDNSFDTIIILHLASPAIPEEPIDQSQRV